MTEGFPGNADPDRGESGAGRGFDWRRDIALGAINLDELDLLTVDVFDTLLFRRCGAVGDLHAAMETEARRHGALTDVLPADAFPGLRAMAEQRARDKAQTRFGHREVTLDAIYADWPAGLGDPDRLTALEIATERSMLVANPYIVDLFGAARAAGLRVWLISDCYHTEATLSALLAACGVAPPLYERLIVSCNHGASKEDGQLFARVRTATGIAAAGRWLHIGDNPVSDVGIPIAQGIGAIHYAAPPALRRVERQEGALGEPLRGGLAVWRRLAARDVGAAGDDAVWFDLGRHVIGPPIQAFCAAIVRYCREHGIRRVAPFLREGAILSAIIGREAERVGWTLDARPLAVSREALFLPSAPERLDRGLLVQLARTNSGRTVGDALRVIGFDNTPPPSAGLGNRVLADLLGAPDDAFQRLVEAVETEEAQARFTERRNATRAAAVAYLTQELGENDAVATVDLGARGSTQAMIGRIPRVGDRYHFHHHVFYAVSHLLNHLGDGHRWLPFAGLDRAALDRGALIYRSPQLVELALIGDLPTTVGYRRTNGAVEPVTLPAAGDAAQARRLAACQRGVLHAAAVMGTFSAAAASDAAATVSVEALAIIFRLIQAPLPEEAAAASTLLYDLNDGLRTTQAVADADALQCIRDLGAPHPASLPPLAAHIRPSLCPWPQAAITQMDPHAMIRLYEAVTPGMRHDTYVRLLLEHLKGQGVDRVILCAAGGRGGMGPTFLEQAPAAGLHVDGYFDYYDQGEAESAFLGLPALRVGELAQQPCTDFVVVSAGYWAQIAGVVEKALNATSRPYRILMLPIHRH